ncbi:hypothetical protein [Pseudoalteromonas luteoviolacea]|uniref:Uncharacterized protein n=1 Tax=Pseudoalteromonas luteoviolacea NCIMB 1942 TaxID=1365253 RepID=A0A167C593_9GAMM|nr:hypothetical protein [Pseudoalteromonas luteoviolacea]KZN47254.1 hypothetical protein N482_10080 [Pseudoalteromonas luteoviolacea NCIMB 1942]
MKLKLKANALKTLNSDQQRLPNQLTRQIAADKYPVTISTGGIDACLWLTC